MKKPVRASEAILIEARIGLRGKGFGVVFSIHTVYRVSNEPEIDHFLRRPGGRLGKYRGMQNMFVRRHADKRVGHY